MKQHLEPRGIRIHTVEFTDPHPVVFTASMLFIKPGLAIIDPDKMSPDVEVFSKSGWDVIPIENPSMPPVGKKTSKG